MLFEKKFAKWQRSTYAVSAATGTAALNVSLTALGIGLRNEHSLFYFVYGYG